MRILAVGDVIGSIGCEFLRSRLPSVKRYEGIDLVICNGENSADGNGVTPKSAEFIFQSGVDIITLGNHAFRRSEIYAYLDEGCNIIRPYNFPLNTTPGKGVCRFDMGRLCVTVINLMGTTYMENLDCPFKELDEILAEVSDKIIIVDFHAEATSEKQALGYYADGRVSAVFGTHTHVQTSDERVLPCGTGFITDVGMTGPKESVLGVKPEIIIKKFKEKLPVRFEIAEGDCKLNAIIFDIDEVSGKTISVERIQIE